MAQELGVIEKDPDFINPYKKETQFPVVSFFVVDFLQLVTKLMAS